MSSDAGASRAHSMFPREPRRVGKFEFLMRLGQGGMATVYLARTLGTGGFQRLVAIKLMHQFLGADEQFVEMFLDEARVAANIRHPNVVSILDLGNEGEQLYMVMDYVEGDTLAAVEGTAARLGRAIPLGVVLRIALDSLSGLDAAHELKTPDGVDLKVVHRDVSPQNILVGIDGTARLTDFGIARAEQRIATTRTGMLKGKAPFMAPEQFEGRPVDRRADVFAMGVTLWESIALRRLFPGRETYEQALRNNRAPYRKLRDILPTVPESLDDIVRKALAHNPNDRYPNAAAFADALEQEFRSTIATSRQVGTFMATVAADKIQRERDAVRAAPKPADANARNARTAIRNTYGARKADEPVSPTAARAFESRPPVRTSERPQVVVANDVSHDDPEVAAALAFLNEMPVTNVAHVGLQVPAEPGLVHAHSAEEAGATVAGRKPRPMDDLPVPASRVPSLAPEASRRPTPLRSRSTLQIGAPRRDADVDAALPAVAPAVALPAVAPAAALPAVATSAGLPAVVTPSRRRTFTGAARAPVDAQAVEVEAPSPVKPVSSNTGARTVNLPSPDATAEFELVRAKASAATSGARVKPLLDTPPVSLRPPSLVPEAPPSVRPPAKSSVAPDASPRSVKPEAMAYEKTPRPRRPTFEKTLTPRPAVPANASAPGSAPAGAPGAAPEPAMHDDADDDQAATQPRPALERHVAKYPSFKPSPRRGPVLSQRWVSGFVALAVALVVVFVLTR